jgi:hypothetical protein
MSNSASSTDASTVKAAEDRHYQLADKKRAKEFMDGIKAAVAKLHPTGTQWTRFSGEGGAKRKRTTRTKKMKRRHARKSHLKFKRVMKRDRI